jgi:hypothetical protein
VSGVSGVSGLPAPRPVAEYEGVDRARFEAEIRPLGQPAVLRGLARDWPAVQAAVRSDEEFIDYVRRFRLTHSVTILVGDPAIKGRFFYADDMRSLNFGSGKSPIDPFLDRLLRDRDKAEPFAIALQSTPVPDLLPGFERENATVLLDPSVVPRMWMGNAARVAAHYDLKENIGCVVAGRRRFTLYPPEQIGNLYPGPLELTPAGTPVSVVDPQAPDLERYPRFAEAAAAAQSAELRPGDAIYIPYLWWHAVDSLEPVNLFINYWWNPARQDLGSPYDALMFGMFALRALPEDQRAAWRAVFDHYVFETNGDPAAHIPEGARGALGAMTPEQLARMRATLRQILRGI